MTTLLAAIAVVGPQLMRLPNGIPVIVQATTDQRVAVEVLVRADDLTAIETGGMETLAGALLGETENYSLNELRRLAWSVGGSISTTFAGDCVRLSITTTAERLSPTAALISDALRKPAFTPESLAQAKLAEREHQNWIDRTPPLRDIFAALGNRGLGSVPVTTLTRDQALALHAKVFRPERVTIAVVGKVGADDVAKVFGASLGLWNSNEPDRAQPLRADLPRSAVAFRSALALVHGPDAKSPEFVPWMIACVALAEGKGSFLNQEYRVMRGSSYVVGSYLTFREGRSFATFYVSTTGDAPTDLVARVANFTPTSGAIRRARAFLSGRYLVGGPTDAGRIAGFAVGHESPANAAFWLAWWEMRGAGIARDAKFPAMVTAASDEEVLAACASWKPIDLGEGGNQFIRLR